MAPEPYYSINALRITLNKNLNLKNYTSSHLLQLREPQITLHKVITLTQMKLPVFKTNSFKLIVTLFFLSRHLQKKYFQKLKKNN